MGRSAISAKSDRGQRAYLSGLSAEDAVWRHLQRQGQKPVAQRWRGTAGEIDLILMDAGCLVFVEVKHAKSFAAAHTSLTARQIRRIHATAAEFLGTMPAGQLTDLRFDLALVDGTGQIRVFENAFGHF